VIEYLLPDARDRLGIDFIFAKIDSVTDKMLRIFANIYDTTERKIIILDHADAAASFVPSVVKTVYRSVTASVMRSASGAPQAAVREHF